MPTVHQVFLFYAITLCCTKSLNYVVVRKGFRICLSNGDADTEIMYLHKVLNTDLDKEAEKISTIFNSIVLILLHFNYLTTVWTKELLNIWDFMVFSQLFLRHSCNGPHFLWLPIWFPTILYLSDSYTSLSKNYFYFFFPRGGHAKNLTHDSKQD